jgi:glucose-1-phosphate cytidylyltransferase
MPDETTRYSPKELPVVIFCGGHGTRLKEETEVIPKPLVHIGERPILWHIMKIYYAQGFRKFVLLTGYKSERIKHYFYQYPVQMSDFTVRYANGVRDVTYHTTAVEDWEVTILDTGLMTETAGRLKRAQRFLENSPFMLTYGDGVADVDLKALLAFHAEHRPLVTVTGVHPPGRFGEIRTDGPYATNFWEKPNVAEGYINGGFLVVEPEIYSYITDDELASFEKHVLPHVARDRKMTVMPHHGYWQCMDTLRDMEHLNGLWKQGQAPWRIWDR